MSNSSERFPSLRHLEWARFSAGRGQVLLGSSQVDPPPREVFDTGGEMPLVIEPALRDRLLGRIATRYGVGIDEITLTAGVSEGLYVVSARLVEPGSWVLVESPCYQSLRSVPESLGAHVVALARGADGVFDPSSLSERIKDTARQAEKEGSRLAVVYCSDLHNPSGAGLGPEILESLAETSEQTGAAIVLDSVYRDSDSSRAIGSARKLYPSFTVLSSLTKAYGMGGLRAGWILSGSGLRADFERIQGYLSVQPSAPSMVLAERALGHADRILGWARARVGKNATRLRRTLESDPMGFVCSERAETSTIAFLYRPGGPDMSGEVQAWLDDYGVEVVPGSFFGAPEGFRLGLGSDPTVFSEAIRAWALAAGKTLARYSS